MIRHVTNIIILKDNYIEVQVQKAKWGDLRNSRAHLLGSSSFEYKARWYDGHAGAILTTRIRELTHHNLASLLKLAKFLHRRFYFFVHDF